MTASLPSIPPIHLSIPLVHGFADDFDRAPQRGSKDLPIGLFQEQDGTGLLDFTGTTNPPGYSAGDETAGIRWNNVSTPDPVIVSFTMPRDIDTSYDAILRIRAAKTGNTVGDTVDWLVEVFNNALAALYDADSDYGGTSTSMTGNATAKTVQESTLVLAAANLGDPGDTVVLTIQPTDGKLGTDDVILLSVELDYVRTNQRWLSVGDAGGSAVVSDGAGGVLTVQTGGTDNDEFYCISAVELLKVAANKPITILARVKFTEANTDDANMIFGFMDVAGANSLLDDSGGPSASYDGAVIFKVDGETRWRVESSNAGTQVTTETDVTAGGSWQTLRIDITPINAKTADVVFWIDPSGGQDLFQVREQSAVPQNPAIKHTLSISGLEEMHLIFGAKAGGGNAESLLVDYVSVWQKR